MIYSFRAACVKIFCLHQTRTKISLKLFGLVPDWKGQFPTPHNLKQIMFVHCLNWRTKVIKTSFWVPKPTIDARRSRILRSSCLLNAISSSWNWGQVARDISVIITLNENQLKESWGVIKVYHIYITIVYIVQCV